MLIVTKIYSDRVYEILNTSTYEIKEISEDKVRRIIGAGGEILGIEVNNGRVVGINSYKYMQFDTEAETDDYIKENKITNGYKESNHLYIPNTKIIQVVYVVYVSTEVDTTYISRYGDKYTPYIQSAEHFDKEEAYALATKLSKNSKTGKAWKVRRILK